MTPAALLTAQVEEPEAMNFAAESIIMYAERNAGLLREIEPVVLQCLMDGFLWPGVEEDECWDQELKESWGWLRVRIPGWR